jgi:outer membrane receptor protein involved in Fe transport
MSTTGSKPLFRRLRINPVTAAVGVAIGSYSASLLAQQAPVIEEIVVTATRRANTVQDIPINITAIGSQDLRDQRLVGLEEIARVVPGLQIVDRGPRDEVTDIVARGLNTSGLGPGFTSDTVATYLGEVPLPVDLKTNDLDRVEVLIGPQGTLYGSGTLGGAVRYIPRKPQNEFEAEVRGKMFSLDHSDGMGSDVGFTLNVPLIDDTLAFRASIDHLDDPGFIDYPYVVRVPGVSDPDPDFNDPADVAANLRRVKDANGENTLSGRLGLRWTPGDAVDATLWYYYQDVQAEGRSLANVEAFNTGKYEAAYRYEEPNDYTNELIALEITADLGFAEFTSATGLSTYMELGQRDQTDLLLDFEYGYEFFPSFSSFTREFEDLDTTTQEFRLVSNGSGRSSWIAGYFYSNIDDYATSEEFTPGYDQFAVDNFGGVSLRPDMLEYYSVDQDDLTEQALYGEFSYAFADDWEVTLGARLYEFEETLTGGFALPLYYTVFLGYPQDYISPSLATNHTKDSGTLTKINLSHNFTNDVLGYVTVSEGYRLGGLNPVPECTPAQISSGSQQLCALPDEILIKADTTTNFEVGVHSTLAGGNLVLNADVYFIDWNDIQVDDTTINGSLPITSNGGKAESKGLEVALNWHIGSNWTVSGSYAYNKAELKESTSALLGDDLTGDLLTPAGTRLPGSPEQQGSLGVLWETSLDNGWSFDVRYGLTYMGNVLNSLGAEQEPSVLPWRGEKIPAYTLQSLTIGLSSDRWRAAFYVDNLTDEYAITGTRTSRRLLEQYRGSINGVPLRTYGHYIARPRTAGISFSYDF